MPNTFSLSEKNPHYFSFREKPTVLITSAEHYGAVLNGKFNYEIYLEELHAHGLNHTRLFSGVYHEVPGSFGIKDNVLAPAAEAYICPWPRTNQEGAFDGGARYDLDKWNPAYFERLKDFFQKANDMGIVVEMNLFCPFYTEVLWDICPLNHQNNINGIGSVPSHEVHTLLHPEILQYQEAVVRKIAAELNGFDNLYYEICNEPWVNGVTDEWQHHMAEVIAETEKGLEHQHLISLNISNGYQVVDNPHEAISIFNFHYASPPVAVAVNYGLNKPIGFNETGFAGQSDFTYRHQAWEFIMAGGALYNNLDYSFTAGYEDGTYPYDEGQPGGGTRTLRKQLGILKRFIESFDFTRMVPDNSIIKRLAVLNGAGYVLADPGKAYAMYIRGWGEVLLELDVPYGLYSLQWMEPKTGEILQEEEIDHREGHLKSNVHGWKEDLALKILRKA